MTSLYRGLLPVESYWRSKRAKNDASDGFNLEPPKLAHASIPTSWSSLPDMTSLTSPCGSGFSKFKNGRNAASNGFAAVYLENRLSCNHQILQHVPHSTPKGPKFAPHITSLTTSGRKLQRKKTLENAASDGFRWNLLRKVYARITKFHKVVGDNCPQESAWYNVAGCFRSAAKSN